MQDLNKYDLLPNVKNAVIAAQQFLKTNKQHMSNGKLAINGLLHAAGTVVYIVLISLLLNNAERFFQGTPEILIAITMLSLLVVSASIVGTIMLGRPMLWYFNGAKTEGVKLFLYSLIWLLGFVVLFFILMATALK